MLELWNKEYRVIREDADTATVLVPWKASVNGETVSGEAECTVAKTIAGALRVYGSEERLLYQANRMECTDARNQAASDARSGGNKEERLTKLIQKLQKLGVSQEDILSALR